MVDKSYKRMRMPSELEQPPLSADLEWMLSSSQVSTVFILEALVRGYYPSLHRLAHILLNDAKGAERLIQETVENVIRKRQRYHGQTKTEIWLYQLLLENGRHYLKQSKSGQNTGPAPVDGVSAESHSRPEQELLGALDDLDYPTRMLVCLHYLYGFRSEEIAQVLERDITTVEAQLSDARRWLHLLRPQAVQDGEAAEAWVRGSIEQRWPQLNLDETEQQKLVRALTHQIEQGDRRKKMFVIVQQALSTIVILVLVAITGWMSSRIVRLRPQVVVKVTATPLVTQTAPLASSSPNAKIPPTVSVTPTPRLHPLSVSSTIDEIRQRMFISRSLWKKAWVDALLIRYGPPGYVGPAQVYRNQMWISNPTQDDPTESHLVIAGLIYDDPIYAMYTQGQDVYTVDLRSSVQYTYPRGNANPIHDLASPVHLGMYGYDQLGLLDGSYLSDMLFSAGLVSVLGDLEIVEQNRYLDRDILILTNVLQNGLSERLMVDTVTGIVLSWMGFLTGDPDNPLAEIIVLNLEFDAPFPERMVSSTFFWQEPVTWVDHGNILQVEPDPTQAIAAALLRGGSNTTRPRIKNRLAPPQGYDPSNSCLTFQWPEETGARGDTEYQAEIYADGYYLGETFLSDPWQILCERSASGGLIACLEPPQGLRNWLYAPSSLSWFNLSVPSERHDVFPEAEYISSDFAFSPDSRYLAFWACLGRGDQCGVYLHDTQNGENTSLTPLENGATFFVWSPDNQYLAFVGAGPNLRYASSLLVVDVKTGEVLDEGAFLWPELALPIDSPVRDWGVEFPPVQGEFEACNPDR